MPANTPIYGFTYPCESEAVNAASFATLAQQIDTKMLDVKADADMAVGRYNSIQSPLDQGGVNPATETALTTNPNSTYTVIQPGIYIVDALYAATATTITSLRLRVKNNATQIYGRTHATPDAPAIVFGVLPGCTVVCAAGDVLSTTVYWTGTGVAQVSLRLDIRMIVRIP